MVLTKWGGIGPPIGLMQILDLLTSTPELLRKFRNLRVQNQRVLSDLHAWAVRTISSVSNKNRLLKESWDWGALESP